MFRGKSSPSQPQVSGNYGEEMKRIPRNPHVCTVFVVANDAEEFDMERRTLWADVLPDLQNFAFQTNFDLEFSDVPLEKGELSNSTSEHVLKMWKENPRSWIVLLLGNRYGNVSVPTSLRKEEYESIRSSIFEENGNVRVFEKAYTINRNGATEEYRLVPSAIKDKKQLNSVIKAVQSGAKAAHEEGTINQLHEARQNRFFASPLESFVRAVLATSPCRCLFLLRKFDQLVADPNTPNSFLEIDEANSRKLEDLKNEVTLKMNDRVMTHVLRPETIDINYFFNSRDGDKYREKIARQFNEKLKNHLSELNPPVRPEAPRCPLIIAAAEAQTHNDFLENQLSFGNMPREYDKRLDELSGVKINRGVFLIQGPDLCGKTQALCRLYNKIPSTDAYKIILFTNLTYSSNFAHEVWRTVCVLLCQMAGIDMKEVLQHFKLTEILKCLENIVRKADKPVCIFLDDVHLLKCGHLLSQMGRRTESAPDNLSLFMTSSNITPVNAVFAVTQTVNIDMISDNEAIGMIQKIAEKSEKKLTNEQLSTIRATASAKDGILVAKSFAHEILHTGYSSMKNGIEGRITRIEKEFGKLAVQCVCKFIAVSSHGLTRLEIHDAISAETETLAELEMSTVFPILTLDDIIEALGPMVRKVIIDDREVISFSHVAINNFFKAKYITTGVEVRAAHLQLSDLFADLLVDSEASPRHEISYQSFSQGIKRDNGTPNFRRLRLLWYHCLHSGNLDRLKELALCHFEYIDFVTRYFGIAHLLSMFEECATQVLHHDLQVLSEQVLVPALVTMARDSEQLAAEVIGRLRYTRPDNSHFLNTLVEQAMSWVDLYNRQPLLVPLTCWISPPSTKVCRSFTLKDWKPGNTVLTPLANHQYILISGNQTYPGVIYAYHVASEKLVGTFRGHTAAVTCLCSSHNRDFFISTSADKTVKKWNFNMAAAEAEMTLTHHTAKVTCAILTTDDEYLITASADSSAKMIKMETGEVVRSFNDHTGSVVSLQLTSNNNFLITGSGDFVVQMWDVSNGKCISRMGGLMAPVSTLAITSNDAFVVVACEDETLKVFSTVGGQELHELMGHEGRVNSLVCAQDDCQLFAATKSKIFCYDIHNGQMIDVLDVAQPFPICSLKISSDNFFLISACGPKVTIWNVTKRNLDAHDVPADAEGFLTSVALSVDDKYAACGTNNGIVALWDLEVCQCIFTTVQSRGEPITCLQYSIDSQNCVSGNKSGSILVLDAQNGGVIRELLMHSCQVVSILPLVQRKMVSCDSGGKMVVWELYGDDDTPEMVAAGVVPPIFLPPSGKIMVGHCSLSNKEMKVWTFQDEQGPTIRAKLSHADEITCFATSPKGGNFIATGSRDSSLKIWQIDNGFLTQVLVGHENVVTCCCISFDERLVVSGARDEKMIVWNVQSGEMICSVNTSAPITSLSMTGDSTVVFSTTEDGWVETWSTTKGRLLSTFNAHRPIKKLINSYESHRMLLLLENCAQLPILCLHNTPAVGVEATRRRSARATSVSSANNEPLVASGCAEIKKDPNLPSNNGGNGPTVTRPAAPKPTFDMLERSKSRTSLIEKDRATTLTTNNAPPPQKSNMCIIL